MSIKFDGMDDVLKAIKTIEQAKGLEAALGKACALVEGEARKKAPKDNGELRRSITSKVDNIGGELVGVVYTPLEYAPYVEYGTGLFAENGGRKDVPWHYQDEEGEWHSTKGQKPQPFMRPALNDNRKQIIKILKEGVKHD